MKVQKRELSDLLDAIPSMKDGKDAIVTFLPHTAETVMVEISHPLFEVKWEVHATELEKRNSYTFSSLKKALKQTKAKWDIVLTKDSLSQENGLTVPLESGVPFPHSKATITPIEVNGKTFAEGLKPLTVFPEIRALQSWRNEVFLQGTEEGFRFSQTNGVYFSSFEWFGDKFGTLLSPMVFPSSVFNLLVKMASAFKKALLLLEDNGLGLYEHEHHQVFIKGKTGFYPPVRLPDKTRETRFHLNPVKKKPFEKVLLENLKKYRDLHHLEYPDIRLNFKAEQDEDVFRITALATYKQEEYTELCSTTSPFFMGDSDILDIPAYDFVKALNSFQTITSLIFTDRGVQIEQFSMEENVAQTIVFLHGFKTQKKIPA
ncbi:hypothetical protein JK635_07980 [Neobacillus sp. YIM B02564]|uniref:Uncharacterized protein n=1 Tax=Neobacillus paridis TaxID=2803862 RepID=A0ABS1TLE5_9BACI|nr:hypothetical protein [Neobacillus paridis]MBL4952149.1 hypothetical protein [Neobacillus paridis]